jgi:hypothetical protein
LAKDGEAEIRMSEIRHQTSAANLKPQTNPIASWHKHFMKVATTRINSAKDLAVYKAAYNVAMEIFELSKKFPPEERYALTHSDQAFIAIGLP